MSEEFHLMVKRIKVVTAVLLTGAIAACSALDMGPEPDNFVGKRPHGAISLTDPNLNAVTPAQSGSAPAGRSLGGAGASDLPETMPSATEPTTTLPSDATNPSTQAGLGIGETVGRTALPPGAFDPSNELTLEDAIIGGLQDNTGLIIERLNVPIVRTNEETQRSIFDPVISGNVTFENQTTPGKKTVTITNPTPPPTNTTITVPGTNKSYTVNGDASISEYLPTGTTVALGYTTNNGFYNDINANAGPTLTVTQKLLRGGGLDTNLASLRQAELDTKVSQYELRAQAELLVATIEEDYWDLAFAEREVVIVQNALDVAQALLYQTNQFIKNGKVADSERAAAEAQVALEQSNLINAKSDLEKFRLRLLTLLAPNHQQFWKRTITVKTPPSIPIGTMDSVERHVDVALRLRNDVNEAKLQLQRGTLDVVVTKNGLLPELDFFVSAGKTGFGDRFDTAFGHQFNDSSYDIQVGISGDYAIGNRAPRAAYRRAVLNKEVLSQALDNQMQLVQVDVRTQYIEVERTRQQIDATRATRIAQAEAVRVETEKYKLGRSTTILVAQAQRDLLTDQLAEVQAVTGHLKSLVELYRLEGSLLFRRGIQAPGGEPVADPAWRK